MCGPVWGMALVCAGVPGVRAQPVVETREALGTNAVARQTFGDSDETEAAAWADPARAVRRITTNSITGEVAQEVGMRVTRRIADGLSLRHEVRTGITRREDLDPFAPESPEAHEMSVRNELAAPWRGGMLSLTPSVVWQARGYDSQPGIEDTARASLDAGVAPYAGMRLGADAALQERRGFDGMEVREESQGVTFQQTLPGAPVDVRLSRRWIEETRGEFLVWRKETARAEAALTWNVLEGTAWTMGARSGEAGYNGGAATDFEETWYGEFRTRAARDVQLRLGAARDMRERLDLVTGVGARELDRTSVTVGSEMKLNEGLDAGVSMQYRFQDLPALAPSPAGQEEAVLSFSLRGTF